MDQQAALELPFLELFGQGKKVEGVRVAQDLLSHVGAFGRKRPAEVADRLPFPQVHVSLDHVNENVATPAVFDSGVQIP